MKFKKKNNKPTTWRRCKNIPRSGSSMNRRSSSLRSATVCKAKPLCFCRPFRGRGRLTMPAILSTLMPQMTVSVAPRQVTESRDQRYTQAATPAPAWARNQARPLITPSAVPAEHTQALAETRMLWAGPFHSGLSWKWIFQRCGTQSLSSHN